VVNPAAGTSGRPVSVLAVMAHADDGELWAGGTLALDARDAVVTLAIPQHEPARIAEAHAGAAILGVRLHVLPSPVSADAVHELITGSGPDVVITHPLADVHPDHRQIAATVLAALPEAVISTAHPQRVYTTRHLGPMAETDLRAALGSPDREPAGGHRALAGRRSRHRRIRWRREQKLHGASHWANLMVVFAVRA
jgi:LmbE family N-acetylglucosaminyl deacetylase